MIRYVFAAAIAFAASVPTGASAYNGGCTDRSCRQWNDEGPMDHVYRDFWANLRSLFY